MPQSPDQAESLKLHLAPGSATRRRDGLKSYLESHVLVPNGFVCRHAENCKASHPGQFYEGQLHHVGLHYDLVANGAPLRIAVIGQEYGHNPIHVNLEQRYDMVVRGSGEGRRFKASGNLKPRNPHMRGTTSLLRLIFGLGTGHDYEGEFISIDGQSVHVFDAFALVDYLLCSAVGPDAPPPSRDFDVSDPRRRGAQRGIASSAMLRNCADHFRQALTILAPTLIVAQGRGVRRWIAPALNLPRDPEGVLEEVSLGGQAAYLLNFTHPSAPRWSVNWGTNGQEPYLLDVVKPNVAEAMARLTHMAR
jgi:hypothetical protein